ncbi:unnamed protein product [Didymodactylos carnosus]|uniref:Uncharacterized protein n=1 Tax=Didymodactylos carnosus TaxID=1234261 RepID=A0A815P277_9BILA|nr:unnamed protein product [Didymodactylos carnosus]CAF1443144.1 unnamed protein product [Didymodactylos carnosus]CAF3740703.1 unnamed protein product [Didymodactylos carnosus]CAF4318634.1 unnamed protein product [Didymodactylos carnosus]
MSSERVILVTGANKGIGFELVKKLVGSKDTVVLACRDLNRGQEALKQLGNQMNVHLIQLDTSSPQSIQEATEQIKKKFGHLDVLVNNAGIAKHEKSLQAATEIFGTNYHGIKKVNQHFLPLMNKNGRIVNVSSEVGAWTLDQCSDELKQKLLHPNLTEAELDKIVESFFHAIENHTEAENGFPAESPFLIYGMSKTALNMYTRIHPAGYESMIAVCPGYCATDLNNHTGGRTASVGADSVLFVVNDKSVENGKFYQDGKLKPWSYPCDTDLTKLLDSNKQKQK